MLLINTRELPHNVHHNETGETGEPSVEVALAHSGVEAGEVAESFLTLIIRKVG